jgi:hypothetical protein
MVVHLLRKVPLSPAFGDERDDTLRILAWIILGLSLGLFLANLTVIQNADDSYATHDVAESCRNEPVQVGSRGE